VILDVKTADGTVLYEYRPPPPIPVMNQQSLQDMNQMMYEVIQTGTGRRAELDSRPAAAKTGTSQDWRDAWFVGYTADFITGVWVGNDDNSSMNKVVGGSLPANVWKAYMVAAHRNVPVHNLPGIDMYGDSSSMVDSGEENPWVDRDGEYAERHEDRGAIEEFFDSLFGGGDDRRTEAPPPPPPPRYQPQSNQQRDEEPTDEEIEAANDGTDPDVVAGVTRRRRQPPPGQEEPADPQDDPENN
jgi:penicillin-binding protein 1A